MPTGGKSTLTQFLIEERRREPSATGELNALITDVSLACKAISRKVALGALDDVHGNVGLTGNSQPLDAHAHRIFLSANEWGGHVAGMLSVASHEPHVLPPQYPRGKYLLLFSALDGGANADVNASVGSIFSVLRADRPGEAACADDFLRPGTGQVCAGYAIYGPSTMLVLTLGNGTHAFTLDPMLGEWVLSNPRLLVPTRTCEFAIDATNSRFWESAVKRYVDECVAGEPGPRGNDFQMHWIASLVAETHRILMRGGVFLCPREDKDLPETTSAPQLNQLCQANAIAFLIEQAGGSATDGRSRLMALKPRQLHEKVGLIFGSSEEVTRIEAYHREAPDESYASPLFTHRGLFANAA